MKSVMERLSGGDQTTAKLIVQMGEYRDAVETIIDPAVRDTVGPLPVLAVQRLESGWRVFCEDTQPMDDKWVYAAIRFMARILTIDAFHDAEIIVVSSSGDARREVTWRQITERHPCIRAVLYALPILSSECDKFPERAHRLVAVLGEAFRSQMDLSRSSFRVLLESLRVNPVAFTSGHPLWGLTVLLYGIIWGEILRREAEGAWYQPAGDGRPEVRVGNRTVRPFEQIAHSFTHGYCVPN